MSLLADRLSGAAVLYEVPDDDIVGEVFIPAMESAEQVLVGAGFFSSKCLAQIAPGLASFLANGGSAIRLLMSPAISDEDRLAIESATKTPAEVLDRTIGLLFEGAALCPSRIAQHSVECLAYLLAAGRLELRVVLMPSGQYHKKFWIFRNGGDSLAIHGSGNATERGLLVNGEQMSLDRSWEGESAAIERITKLVDGWTRQWEDRSRHSTTVKAENALKILARLRGDRVPTTADFWAAWRDDSDRHLEPTLPSLEANTPRRRLSIPEGLSWTDGRYGHQGRAVDAFEAAGRNGILAIATGGGKTKTSLIAASRFQAEQDSPFLLLVLVPSLPLASQWVNDLRTFGIEPVVLGELDPLSRRAQLHEIGAALRLGASTTEVLVVTNQLFASDRTIREFIDGVSARAVTMLIADEVHNLGVASFINDPPTIFKARLGLSATPIRQYDPDGTDKLFDFFGRQIFEFGLDEAIRSGCLVPYDYHLVEVRLTEVEMEGYEDLTYQLRRLGFQSDDDGRVMDSNDRIKKLLRDRRSVLEHADEKLDALRRILVETGPARISKALIYASGKKAPEGVERQLDAVNALLRNLGISFHQFTAEETATPDAARYLRRFAAGDLQILTAMKVLDEGVDMPSTDTAFLLASSSVRREWVQRRGRILRTAEGKTKAKVYDFLVVPPSLGSAESLSVLRGELLRANAFAELALNEYDRDGPRKLISKYEKIVWKGA